tara:strand:+ start:30925 stop:32007 length:1083 start_codon:yes stop_codon:yes gene_type:complete
MDIQPVNIVHSLVVWLSLLYSIILITPKYNKKPSNKFLSLLLLSLGIHFGYNVLYTNGYFLDTLPFYSCLYGYLYGPLFFLHIKFHLRKDTLFKPIDWLHFFPFFLILIITFFGYSLCGLLGIYILPTMLSYCFFSYKEIRRYKRIILQVSSKNHTAEIKWLETMLIIMLVIVFINLIQTFRSTIFIGSSEISLEIIVQIGVLILVNTIVYQGIKNPQLFQQISKKDEDIVKVNIRENLNTEALKEFSIVLDSYFKKHKPYLNSDLNINTLSNNMNVSAKSISQTINNIIGCNFTDYINSHRIDEAKNMLKNSMQNGLSIKEIMYDVGFNSRSVFNTLFKKKTGLTPSQYKILHQKRSDS